MGKSDPLSAYAARFAGALNTLDIQNEGRLCLAVSGGSDSMAMLLLAHHAFPDRCVAATVDHGLRKEAAQEAEFAAQICGERAIPHSILRSDNPIKGNIQSQARKLRYQLLQDHAAQTNCDWIATAHHGDDQMETFLMRLNRGSGVDGLSAIRAKNGNIIRPMLDFRRSETEEICEISGIKAVQDPSNQDENFDRVKMRGWLAQNELPFTPDAVLSSTSALSEASAALSWMTDHLAETRISKIGAGMSLQAADLPSELQRRLLSAALQQFDPGFRPRGESVTQALKRLCDGQKAMLGNILILPGNIWQIRLAPPRSG